MTSLPPYIRIEPQNRNDLATIQCKPKINVITENLCHPLFDRKRTQSNSLVRKSISILTFCCIALVTNSALANSDRDALVALYIATNGPNWLTDTNWRSNKPIDEWYGVYTDDDGRVIQIFLNQNNLSGTLPTELGDLSRLKQIHLYGNKLSGSLPSSISALVELQRLWLDDNEFMGTIPSVLGHLDKLTDLTLNNNQFRGQVPNTLLNLSLNRFWWYNSDFCVQQSSVFDSWLDSITDNRPGFRCPTTTENPTWNALVTLFNATDGANWTHNENWYSSAPLSNWHGVVVDAQDRVVSLELDNNNLVGALPSAIADITSLRTLILSNNHLKSSIPSEIGELYNLQELDISGNQLFGTIPSHIGALSNLTDLSINDNELVGRLHDSFTSLNLNRFRWFNAGVCVPDTPAFNTWLMSINDNQPGKLCPVVSSLVLISGNEQSGDAGVALEHPVVIRALDQTGTPMEEATVTFMTGIGHGTVNPISVITDTTGEARTEWSLGIGDINQTLTVSSNKIQLEIRATAQYSERKALEALYIATGGNLWVSNINWLEDHLSLDSWQGVATDQNGRVKSLTLVDNNLRGSIPPAIGSLSSLEELNLSENQIEGIVPSEINGLQRTLEILDLSDNRLDGALPIEISELKNLKTLDLSRNHLAREIPIEYGELYNLTSLNLSRNYLSGQIPGSFWRLEEIQTLNLSHNRLSGSVPTWFGDRNLDFWRHLRTIDLRNNRLSGRLPVEISELDNLVHLNLRNNNLTGSVPPEYSRLNRLEILDLAHNRELVGSVPRAFVRMTSLRLLFLSGTKVCAPDDADFRQWFRNLTYWGDTCDISGIAYAYLTQAIQSGQNDVALVWGEPSYLRVFMASETASGAKLPFVRARFFGRNGNQIYRVEIPPSNYAIPTEIDERLRNSAANAIVPALPTGTTWYVEIDPYGRLDPSVGLPNRVPARGRFQISHYNPPAIKIHLFALAHENDAISARYHVRGLRSDTREFEAIKNFLPTRTVTIGNKYLTHVDTRDSSKLLKHVERLRKAHKLSHPTQFAMGFSTEFDKDGDLNIVGRAYTGKFSSVIKIADGFPESQGDTMAHELGHNLDLNHAPAWGLNKPSNIDPYFVPPNGKIGYTGYKWTKDQYGELRIIPLSPDTCDLMGYCGNSGISKYHWDKAYRNLYDRKQLLRHNLWFSDVQKSLLVSGDVSNEGKLTLDPIFVIDAIPEPPLTDGPYLLQGIDFNNNTLFSYSFDMSEITDGHASKAFVFTLPVEPQWSGKLTRVRLSGPTGTIEVREGSERPMVIAKDQRTGDIRAIYTELEDIPYRRLNQRDFDKILPERGLDAMISRGLPLPEDWY